MLFFLSSLFFSFWRLYLEADESAVIARPLISKGNCAIPAAVPHFLTHIHPVQQQPKKYNNTEILIGSNNIYIQQHTRVLYILYAKTLCCVYLFTRLPTSCQWAKRKKRISKNRAKIYILHPCVVHVYLPAASKHLLANLSTQHTKGGKNNNKNRII